MNRTRNHLLAMASLSFGLLVATPALAASLTQVTRSTWAGSVSLPSYVGMYIYVPDKLATKPPIMVSSHSCGSTATGQMGNIPNIKAAADKNGFILILPDNPGQNCWDVGTPQSLKHDGGGDTQAVAQMVRYALTKYNGDASRVYAMGGSSGAMMTQALMAVYPDIFKAGHARAGVPAGCWAESYDSSNQWSGPCAGGSVSKTAQQWGDLVRAMDPGYAGHRPRLQLVQGDADETISYKNMAEAIKEWTNVLALSTTPTSTDTTTTSVATYDRQFWKNACGYTVLEAWSGKGGKHSMAYEQDAILKFFGLDVAGGSDPEDAACSGDAGASGTGGVSGSGGTTGAGGDGDVKDGGLGGRDGGKDGNGDAGTPSSGGVTGSGGSGSGGAVGTGGSAAGTGGSSGRGGASAAGGVSANGGAGTGGTIASGGQGSGGEQSTGGAAPQGGHSGAGGSTATAGGTSSNGCSCSVGNRAGQSGFQLAALVLAALGLSFRRQRRKRG